MVYYLILILVSLAVASFVTVVFLSAINFKFKSFAKHLEELDALLEHLVRRKLLEYGFLNQRKTNREEKQNELLDKCKTLKTLEYLILRNKTQGISSNQHIYLYDFLLSIHERKVNKLKEIKNLIENYTRVPVSSVFLMERMRILLNSELFLLSEEQELFLSYQEIIHLGSVYTFVSLLIEDALKENVTVTKKLEKMQTTSVKQILKTIEYVVLLKLGASSKVLLDEIVLKQNFQISRLKTVTETQKHSAIMSIIRKDYRSYKSFSEITLEIFEHIKKMNKMRNEYLNEHRKNEYQENSRHQQQREQSKTREEAKQKQRYQEHQKYQKHNQEQGQHKRNENKQDKKVFAGGVDMGDAYKILGLDPNCSIRKIKKSYKDLAMKKHPDRFLHLTRESDKKKVHDEFIEIKNAYDKIIKFHKKAA